MHASMEFRLLQSRFTFAPSNPAAPTPTFQTLTASILKRRCRYRR